MSSTVTSSGWRRAPASMSSAITRSLPRARRGVERLIEGSIALVLRNLEQVAQVGRIVVRLSVRGCRDDRPVDVPQRGVPREAEQARHDCADGSMTPLCPEVEDPANVAREAEIG